MKTSPTATSQTTSVLRRAVTQAARIVGGTMALGATAGALTFAYANQIELKNFKLHQVRLDGWGGSGEAAAGKRPLRILHISDLHMTPDQEKKQRWVADLARLEPDLVVNTGDNLGSAKAVPSVMRALEPLLDLPGVFVFGTNDYFGPRPVNPLKYLVKKKRKPSEVKLPWEGMRAAFIERGWRDATHQKFDLTVGDGWKVAFAGVDDPHHRYNRHELIAGPPDPSADFAIGLTHSPEPEVLDLFAEDGYNLVMSGHTHGGQVCLPGGRAIVTNCGIDPSRASGLSRWTERMSLHVTNGLGTSPYAPVRLFCAPSATLIEIHPS